MKSADLEVALTASMSMRLRAPTAKRMTCVVAARSKYRRWEASTWILTLLLQYGTVLNLQLVSKIVQAFI